MTPTEIVQAKIDALQTEKEILAEIVRNDVFDYREVDRRKIVELLGKIVVLQELLEELKSADPWVKVEDALPEMGVDVLCQLTQTSMGGTQYITPRVGKMISEHGRFSCAFDWINVTHWMPLPERPKQ